jgi:hypothetical protein
MTAYLHTTGYVLAEPRVELNPGGDAKPFAVVDLTGDRLTDITVHTATEARGLKEAFARAEEILTAAGRP